MFTVSNTEVVNSRHVIRFVSFAACYFASTQLPAFSTPTIPDANAASTAQASIMLQENVTKSRMAKPKHHADHGPIVKTDHLYYLVYTAPGQTARGDFTARKIFITGDVGSILATDGLKVKVVSGHVHFANEGSTTLSVMQGSTSSNLEPGQEADFGKNSSATPTADAVVANFSGDESKKHAKIVLEPARLWAEENCQFGAGSNGTIELLKGQVVISSSQATKIHTLAGVVDCDPLSLVSVRCSESGLAVENASYFISANVHSHGHTISVDGGRSVVLVTGAPDAEKVPVDGVERRQLYAAFDGYMTVLKSEFKMTSLIKRYRSLRLAMNSPISPFEKNMVSKWVKDIAVNSTLHGDPEDFCEKPQILAVVRLGQFFNPFYGN